MTDITIPPEAVEAAARAAMQDNGCGYTVNGKHVLCDDAICDGLVDAYGKPLRHKCSCRSMAVAALRAGIAAWPGMWHIKAVDFEDKVILPLPQENTND